MKERQIKILQYGEGNFLRAFVDYMVDVANAQGIFNGDIAIVKPITHGNLDAFKRQENRYTVCLRGQQDGQITDTCRTVTSVQRVLDAYTDYEEYMALAQLPSLEFVVSNTTEAGIVFDPECRAGDTPPSGFPGKLTQLLHRRFLHFGGSPESGLVMLPVELIEDNGKKLRACVERYITLWGLGGDFKAWVDTACVFCSTLVDRIVTGYPREGAEDIQASLDFRDELLDVAEPFGLWVIESDVDISSRLPLDKAGQPVVFTRDQRPYRERKVRILNGAHTSTVLAGYLCGLDTVGDCMADPDIRGFMEKAVFEEIVPTVPMPAAEAADFARSVFERFENPFIRHECLSISLNSVSKWKARVLPSLKDYLRTKGCLPVRLTFSLAALLAFYTSGGAEDDCLHGSRGDDTYPIRDDEEVLEFFRPRLGTDADSLVRETLGRDDFWGENLNSLPGLTDAVTAHLQSIRTVGMRDALKA